MKRCFATVLALVLLLTSCGSADTAVNDEKIVGHMETEYAEQFSADYLENGNSLITVGDGSKYILVPENGAVPEQNNITVLQQPLESIYIVATSAMDMFNSLDALENISLSGTKAEDWYIPEAREAVENGKIVYAGKYNTPDYETILSNDCDAAIESTMIYHNPEVKEELEQLGIPVFVERSSYEKNPLGRMEWIRLYGLLLGKEDEADRIFKAETEKLESIINGEKTGKTVAFFSINSNGTVTVRKPHDYISKIIEMAGGKYVFDDLSASENSLSTMNMQIEDFYAGAVDTDIIIYNSTIDAEIETVEELVEKSSLLADFKAVKNGNAWCTGKNMFQESMGTADLVTDINKILNGCTDDELKYIHRIR